MNDDEIKIETISPSANNYNKEDPWARIRLLISQCEVNGRQTERNSSSVRNYREKRDFLT